MINTITIEKLRGVDSACLPNCRALNILVGPNGSGKSTILDGIAIGGHPRPVDGLAHVLSRRAHVSDPGTWIFPYGRTRSIDSIDPRIRITLDGVAGRRRVRVVPHDGMPRLVSAEIAVQWSARVSTWHVRPEDLAREDYSIDDTSTMTPDDADSPADSIGYIGFGQGSRYEHLGVEGYSAKIVPFMRMVDKIPLPAEMVRRYSALVRDGKSGDLSTLLSSTLNDFQRLEVLVGDGEAALHVVFAGRRGAIPVALLGEGLRRLTSLAIELSALGPGDVALVEEPETHLHPRLLADTAGLLAKAAAAGIQLFVTTHSLALLQAVVEACSETPDTMAFYACEWVDGTCRVTGYEGARAEIANRAAEELLWMPMAPGLATDRAAPADP